MSLTIFNSVRSIASSKLVGKRTARAAPNKIEVKFKVPSK